MTAGRSDRKPPGGEDDQEPSLAAYAGVGIQFALTIIVFLFIGQWLDGRLGTAPWLTIVGVFLGAGGGFYSLYVRLTAAQRREDERRGR